MTQRVWLALCLTLALSYCGCGGSAEPTTEAADSRTIESEGAAEASTSGDAAEGPKQALSKFLNAVKAGDDEGAAAMLTTVAREKTSAMGLNVAPPGSDTATFEILQIEMKGDAGAYVACAWTDTDENGDKSTDDVVWVMAREEAGWRIAGMVAKVFPDQDAIVFNFEDPEAMIRKQEMAQQEMERRAAAALGQLTGEPGGEPTENAAQTPPDSAATATSAGGPRR